MAKGRFENPIVATLAGVKDFFRKQSLADRLTDDIRADGKTILITGANSGLGFGLAVDLAKRGAHVIMGCRSQIPEAGEKVKELSGSDRVEMRYLDLKSIPSISAFVDELEKNKIKLDVTVLNAGIALPHARKTDSGQEEMFFVNYMSNVILSNLLLEKNIISADPSKSPKPRIIFVSSDSHRGSSYIDYDEFGKYIDYGTSKGISYYSYYKLVLNTYATELSRRINSPQYQMGIHVICPGPVHSNIIKEAPLLLRIILGTIFSVVFKSPFKAALPLSYMALHPDLEGKTNLYMHMFNPKRMDEKVYISEEGKKLWERSMELWREIDSVNVKW